MIVNHQILRRLGSIGLGSLILGLAFNQFYSDGIKWRWLLPPAFFRSADAANRTGIISADSAAVLASTKTAVFIDIRAVQDYQVDHIPGAINAPLQRVREGGNIPGAVRRGMCVLYDESGNYEVLIMVAGDLVNRGFHPVLIMYGGYFAWLEGHHPVSQGGDG